MGAVTIPDAYLVALVTLGFGFVTSLIAWTAKTLYRVNETLGRHDERITNLEQTRASHDCPYLHPDW